MKKSQSLLLFTCIGFLSLAVAMGIGRFAYTPILPYMEKTHLTPFQAGLLATINYAGYFIGAFFAGKLPKKGFVLGWTIAINFATTLFMGLSHSLLLWSTFRLFSGLSSGIAFVMVSSIILSRVKQEGGKAYFPGFLYGGVGFGIFTSGVLVPPLITFFGEWETAWVGLGIISSIFFVIIILGLYKIDASSKNETIGEHKSNEPGKKGKKQISSLYISYFCEGFGYIIFATFIITMLVSTTNLGWPTPYVWAFVGIGAIPSCLFWAWLSVSISILPALRLAYFIQLIGVLLPIFFTHTSVVVLSALCFGGTFMGITMLTMMAANELFPTYSQAMIGRLTGLYGIGQMLGPLFASLLISNNQYATALMLSAVFILIGFLMALKIKKKKEEGYSNAIREY